MNILTVLYAHLQQVVYIRLPVCIYQGNCRKENVFLFIKKKKHKRPICQNTVNKYNSLGPKIVNICDVANI